MFRASLVSFFILMSGMIFSPPARAADEAKDMEFRTGYTRSKGDYGTGQDTTFTYIPFTLTRYFSKGEVYGTLPIVSVKGNRTVTVVSGGPKKTQDISTATVQTTESGLGDMVTGGRLYGLREGNWMPSVDLTGFLKIPTADEDKGLGTGEFDLGTGLSFVKTFNVLHYGFLDVGYTFVGGYRDQWNWLAGYGYQFAPSWFGSVAYEERLSLYRGADNPRDLYFSARKSFDAKGFADFSLGFGLSDGSPDSLISLGGGVYF